MSISALLESGRKEDGEWCLMQPLSMTEVDLNTSFCDHFVSLQVFLCAETVKPESEGSYLEPVSQGVT